MRNKLRTYLTVLITLVVGTQFLFLSVVHGAASRILHSFDGSDGDEPSWLVQANDGTLWGVTFIGGIGTVGNGVLYKIDRRGAFTVVHKFADTPDGSLPGRLIKASDGTIYGVTLSGGTRAGGTVYKVDLAGNYSALHSFNPLTEGSAPNFLFQASDGFFYGTASGGGIPAPNCLNGEAHGTLFKMDAAGNVTRLHTFCEEIDGSQPNCVVEGSDGTLYGTCNEDGPLGQALGNGTFWKSDKTGNVTLLHVFGPKTLNGDQPTQPRGIVQAADGLFYGVANGGGLSSQGAIFRANANGNVDTIHSFNDFATDGADPESNFVLAADGFFYGTASDGGLPAGSFNNSGVVYRADTAGHVWVLHTFTGSDGDNPVAAPVLDQRGTLLYATSIFRGASDHGTTVAVQLRPNLPVANLTFSPNPVTGGQSSTATVTLSRPAPAQGQLVQLFASGPLTLPQSVTVPAGQTTANFNVNTQPVSISFDATVTAYVGSVGMSSPLTLVP